MGGWRPPILSPRMVRLGDNPNRVPREAPSVSKRAQPAGSRLRDVGSMAFSWFRKRGPSDDHRALQISCEELEEAILGPELAVNRALETDRQQLITSFLAGQASGRSLVGWLLVFRSAGPGKQPLLLRDVGEAFYAWQPRTSGVAGDLETAIVAWLERLCRQAGLPHTIELVNPGERFDASRHNATAPGVEISEVLGWIVLRDGEKVYSKATVAVK